MTIYFIGFIHLNNSPQMFVLLYYLLHSCISDLPKLMETPAPTESPLPSNVIKDGSFLYTFTDKKLEINGNGAIALQTVINVYNKFKEDPLHANQVYFQELYFTGNKAISFGSFTGWNGTTLDMSDTNSDTIVNSKNMQNMINLVVLKFSPFMKQIGVMAFSGCSSIKTLVLPKLKNFFDEASFQGCSSLESVTFLDYAYFGGNMFKGCLKITQVIYCSNVPPTPLGNVAPKNMFDPSLNRDNLNIYVSKTYRQNKFAEINITFHNRLVDTDCTIDNDFSPTIDPTPSASPKPSQTATSVGSVYFSFLGSKIVITGSGVINKNDIETAFDKSNKEINIMGTSIWKSIEIQGPGDFIVPENGFYNDSNYEFIYFYNTGTIKIMKNAFVNCFNLQKVVFNDKIIKVEDYGCKGLKNLYSLSFSIDVELGKFAFQDCRDLSFIKFEGKTILGTAAFLNCDRIKTIYYNNVIPPTFYGVAFASGNENNLTSTIDTIDVQVPNDYQGNSFIDKQIDPKEDENAAAGSVNKKAPMSKYETKIIAITGAVVAIIVVGTTALCVLLIIKTIKINQ